MSDMKAGASPARAEAERIAAANGGSLAPSREQAAEILKARGITQGADGRTHYAPANYTARDHRDLTMVGVKLDPEADAAGVIDGARNFAAALNLDPLTGAALTRDMAGTGDVDPEQVKAELGRAGFDYDALIRDVDAFIKTGEPRHGAPIPIAAKDLSASTLVQLGVLAKFRAERGAKR